MLGLTIKYTDSFLVEYFYRNDANPAFLVFLVPAFIYDWLIDFLDVVMI